MNGKETHVIFAVEKSITFKKYLNELFDSYISPAVSYFSNCLDEDKDIYFTQCLGVQYAVVFFGSELSLTGGCTQIETDGPTASPKTILKAIKEADYSYRNTCRQAYILEAMETAIEAFKYLVEGNIYNDNIERRLILATQSSPIESLWATSSPETIFTELKRIGVKTSIISAHKMVELYKLFESVGGDRQSVIATDYAVQPQHLILLNGLIFQEKVVDPCSNTNVTETNSHSIPVSVPTTVSTNAVAPNTIHSSSDNSLHNARIHSCNMQTITAAASNITSSQAFAPITSDRHAQPAANESSNESRPSIVSPETSPNSNAPVWQGFLEFKDKTISNGANLNLIRIPCKIIPVVNIRGVVNTTGWSNSIHLVFLPKTLLQSVPTSFYQNMYKVSFEIEPSLPVKNLSSILSKGYGAVGYFRDNNQINMIIVVYAVEQESYIGFVPVDQTGFVPLMRQVIISQPRNFQPSPSIEQNIVREVNTNGSLANKITYQQNPIGQQQRMQQPQQLQQQQQQRMQQPQQLQQQQQQQQQQQRLQLGQQQQHLILLQQHQQSQSMETTRNSNTNRNQALPSISIIRPQGCVSRIQPQESVRNSINIDFRRFRQINVGGQRVSYAEPYVIRGRQLNEQERNMQAQLQQHQRQSQQQQQQGLPRNPIYMNVNVNSPRLTTMRFLLQEKLLEKQKDQKQH